MRRVTFWMGVLLLCVSLVPASQAKDQDMVIRFGGMYAMGTGSYESTTIDEIPNFFNLGTLTADATQGYGAFIGFGWKPTDLVELDFGLSWFTMDFDVKDTETVLVLDDAGNVIDGNNARLGNGPPGVEAGVRGDPSISRSPLRAMPEEGARRGRGTLLALRRNGASSPDTKTPACGAGEPGA